MSKQPPLAPTASTIGPCPTVIQISRTPRHRKFTQHLGTTRPPLYTNGEMENGYCSQHVLDYLFPDICGQRTMTKKGAKRNVPYLLLQAQQAPVCLWSPKLIVWPFYCCTSLCIHFFFFFFFFFLIFVFTPLRLIWQLWCWI